MSVQLAIDAAVALQNGDAPADHTDSVTESRNQQTQQTEV
jgi:hypothetical protein